MLYQTFRKFPDGTLAKFGRITQNLGTAVKRAAQHEQGEVRPLGSLVPVWSNFVFTTGTPLKPAAPKPQAKRFQSAPRFVNGSSSQQAATRYHPRVKA